MSCCRRRHVVCLSHYVWPSLHLGVTCLRSWLLIHGLVCDVWRLTWILPSLRMRISLVKWMLHEGTCRSHDIIVRTRLLIHWIAHRWRETLMTVCLHHGHSLLLGHHVLIESRITSCRLVNEFRTVARWILMTSCSSHSSHKLLFLSCCFCDDLLFASTPSPFLLIASFADSTVSCKVWSFLTCTCSSWPIQKSFAKSTMVVMITHTLLKASDWSVLRICYRPCVLTFVSCIRIFVAHKQAWRDLNFDAFSLDCFLGFGRSCTLIVAWSTKLTYVWISIYGLSVVNVHAGKAATIWLLEVSIVVQALWAWQDVDVGRVRSSELCVWLSRLVLVLEVNLLLSALSSYSIASSCS